MAASFAMRFAVRIQQSSESPYGALQDSIICGLVASLAIRGGIGEANRTIERAMKALNDEDVVDALNTRIERANEKRTRDGSKGPARR